MAAKTTARRWKPHYDARLRRYFAFPDCLTDEQIAELFDFEFSPGWIKHRRRKLGLVRERKQSWSAADDARLRELAYTKSWAEVAAALGRTMSGVHQRANKLGITRAAKGKHYAELGFTAFLEEKHAAGWTDTEIEAEWNRAHPQAPICRSCVSARRRKLGLPHNAFNERQRRRVAAKTREQLKRAGLKSLAELRSRSYSAYAARMGWPDTKLRQRAVQVLNLLYERGPHTRRQICEALGLSWKNCRKNGLQSNSDGHTYLANLLHAGLVIRLNRAVRTGRRGGNVSLYAVAPHVKRSPVCPRKETA